VLDDRQELLQRERPAGRVVPAHQRLGGQRLAGVEVDDRLVEQLDLPMSSCSAARSSLASTSRLTLRMSRSGA
jgi:hypothetical protein